MMQWKKPAPNHFPGCPCPECEKLTSPVSRKTDPETSHEAEQFINESGSRNSQARKFLAEIKREPGKTAGELADALGFTMHEASRRLADLYNAGVVTRGEPKVYAKSNRRQVTWYPK